MKHRKLIYKTLFLLALTTLSLLAGCSKNASQKAVENERTSIINAEMIGFRRSDNNVLNVQSVELLSFKAQPIFALNKIFSEPSKKGSDNSSIETLYDRFGNKTEIRNLEDDANLKCIILKTSTEGIKQAIVFGKNGEVKKLPDELSEKALTADGSYIAAAAGIFGLPKTPTANPGIININRNNQPDQALLTAAAAPNFVSVNQIQKTSTDNQVDEKADIKIEPSPQETPNPAKPSGKEDSAPKVKIDSLWLNNAPPKKRIHSNDLTAEPLSKIENSNENNGIKTN